MSPSATSSPSATCHSRTVPSVTDSPISGICDDHRLAGLLCRASAPRWSRSPGSRARRTGPSRRRCRRRPRRRPRRTWTFRPPPRLRLRGGRVSRRASRRCRTRSGRAGRAPGRPRRCRRAGQDLGDHARWRGPGPRRRSCRSRPRRRSRPPDELLALFTCHSRIVPSVTDSPIWGIWISTMPCFRHALRVYVVGRSAAARILGSETGLPGVVPVNRIRSGAWPGRIVHGFAGGEVDRPGDRGEPRSGHRRRGPSEGDGDLRRWSACRRAASSSPTSARRCGNGRRSGPPPLAISAAWREGHALAQPGDERDPGPGGRRARPRAGTRARARRGRRRHNAARRAGGSRRRRDRQGAGGTDERAAREHLDAAADEAAVLADRGAAGAPALHVGLAAVAGLGEQKGHLSQG